MCQVVVRALKSPPSVRAGTRESPHGTLRHAYTRGRTCGEFDVGFVKRARRALKGDERELGLTTSILDCERGALRNMCRYRLK